MGPRIVMFIVFGHIIVIFPSMLVSILLLLSASISSNRFTRFQWLVKHDSPITPNTQKFFLCVLHTSCVWLVWETHDFLHFKLWKYIHVSLPVETPCEKPFLSGKQKLTGSFSPLNVSYFSSYGSHFHFFCNFPEVEKWFIRPHLMLLLFVSTF